MRYGHWITICTFTDGSQYQQRCFNDARGCGLENRIHLPNASGEGRAIARTLNPVVGNSGGDE